MKAAAVISSSPVKTGSAGTGHPVGKVYTPAFCLAFLLFVLVNFVLYFEVKKPAVSAVNLLKEIKQSPLPAGKECKSWPWWVVKGFVSEPVVPDVVVFGSSQMGSALATTDAEMLNRWVDVVVHRRIHFLEKSMAQSAGVKVNVLALSSPGQMVSDGWLLSNLLFKQGKIPKLAVITVAPRDFIDYTLPYPAATEVFNFGGKYLDNQNQISPYLYSEPFALLDYWSKQLPLKIMGELYLSQVGQGVDHSIEDNTGKEEKTATVLNAVAGANGDVSRGVWVVPPQFPDIWQDNTKEYKLRFKEPFGRKYEAEMFFLREWLAYLGKQGTAVVVIGMPSLKMNRDLLPDKFWRQFHQDIAGICANNGAVWSDLSVSEDFQKQDFLDTVHLNARGGKKLFQHISSTVAAHDCLKNTLPEAASEPAVTK